MFRRMDNEKSEEGRDPLRRPIRHLVSLQPEAASCLGDELAGVKPTFKSDFSYSDWMLT